MEYDRQAGGYTKLDVAIGTALRKMAARYYRLIAIVIILTLFLIIPLKITSYGYRPADDAMRHSAHALDDRSWDEVVVQREGSVADTSPGWDFLLRQLHSMLGWDQEALLIFSSVGLCMLFLATGLIVLRDPLAWLIALTAAAIMSPVVVMRINIGRPYIVTICCMMTVVMLWRSTNKMGLRNILLTVLLFMISAWFHGSWYLAIVVPASFLLAGSFSVSVVLGGCWLVGSFAGAVLTGRPVAYLVQQVSHGFLALGEHTAQRQLVGEFRAEIPEGIVLFSIIIILLIRMIWNKCSLRKLTVDPLFILFLIGTILGISVKRFSLDWGFPAGLLWMAWQCHEILKESKYEEKYPLYCLMFAGILSVVFYFTATVDVAERWTHNLDEDAIDASDPALAGWLPDENGIIYTDNMRVFYRTYFNNPTGAWRYILGYEAGLMPDEDLTIYRNIQWNKHVPATFDPWVEKMRAEDRLVVIRSGKPKIEGVDWHLAANDIWIGRKKNGNVER